MFQRMVISIIFKNLYKFICKLLALGLQMTAIMIFKRTKLISMGVT